MLKMASIGHVVLQGQWLVLLITLNFSKDF